ncbi:zinc-ribbon domain-containing protein, partial [Rhodococcus sp. O3]
AAPAPAAQGARFCPTCGTERRGTENFCSNCGQRIG